MCVYSMIMNYFHQKWRYYLIPPYVFPMPIDPTITEDIKPSLPYSPITPGLPKQLTEEEVEDLRQLLEKANKYNKETGQHDYENETKKKQLKDLAKQLGIEISFL